MRSVQTLGSTHDHPVAGASPPRLASTAALPAVSASRGASWRPSVTPSTFLRPFAPRPLRRFFATADALTPDRLSPAGQVSPVHPDDLPTIPSPTTPRSPTVAFARYPSARRASRIPPGLGFALHSQARRNARPNRVRLLRTGRLPPGASHPASRRRSCLWLRGWRAPAPRGLSPLVIRAPGRTSAAARRRFLLPRLDGAESTLLPDGGAVFRRVKPRWRRRRQAAALQRFAW